MVSNNTPFRILGIAFIGVLATATYAQTAPTATNVRTAQRNKSPDATQGQHDSSDAFINCFSGPGVATEVGCEHYDVVPDGHVDLRDVQVLMLGYAPAPGPSPPNLWQIRPALAAPDVPSDPDAPVVDVTAEAAATPPVPADLNPTIDVQITQEIIDKAAAFGSVQAMYEFVRNECAFQAYYGSQKGSVETLRQRAGNDYDLASLLIALLRASGIPARYAVGFVEMPVDRANSWLGVENGTVAGSILYTHGMEGVSIFSGSPDNIVAVQCRRVWVEAYVPRGYGSPAWVPLDPAFKQTSVHPGIDIPEEMPLNAQTFVDEYYQPSDPGVTLPRPETVLELLEKQITDYLAVHHPGMTLADVRRTSETIPEGLGVLPNSLPYIVRSRDTAYSVIPDARRYRIRFHLHNGGTNLIDRTLDLPAIAGKRITIDYVGATPSDQGTIDSYNGLLYTPPYLISIRPVLRVGGQVVATGATGIGAGRTHSSDMYFLAPVNPGGYPVNEVPAIFNTIVAGEYQGVALAVQGTSSPLLQAPDAADTEGFIGQEAYATGIDYLERGITADDELGSLYHAIVTHDVDNAIVQPQIRVNYDMFQNPVSWEWRGLTVDADRKIIGAWKVDELQLGCGGEGKELLILGGAEGSLHENVIFEDDYFHEAVSTIKILELAADQGITIYKQWNTFPLPANSLPASTRSAIQNAIAGGHEVTFPASQITHGQWTGVGYIDMDPCTGAAGYIIAGGQNGGSTVDSWTDFIWTEPSKTVKCVEGKVDVPPRDSPDADALFCKVDTDPLNFEYQLRAQYTDGSAGSWTSRSHRSKSPSQLDAGHYYVITGSDSNCCAGCAGPHRRKLTVLELKSETVATTPADRARTTLGIGEQVKCTIDPPVSVTWSVSGGGAVSPVTGTSTTFTASKSPSNSEVKVTLGTFECALDFSVIAPNGMNAAAISNPGCGTQGPPNNMIGASTIFRVIVLPDTVSFYAADLREAIPSNNWTWPDGTNESWPPTPPQYVPWGVDFANMSQDQVSECGRPVGRIDQPPPGGGYVDFSFSISVPEEYKNQLGTWVPWLPGEVHVQAFRGATQDCRITINATNSSPGTWQGPWW